MAPLASLFDRRAARLTVRLGIAQPILGGPMAGVTTPALVAAVGEGGGLGLLGAGMMQPSAIEQAIAQTRALTRKPFGINLFIAPQPQADAAQVARMLAKLAPYCAELGLPPPEVPARCAPDFAAQFDAVLEARLPVFSFTFGLLDRARLAALHARGTFVIGTASCVAEAKLLAELGCDAVVAQGAETGGHRASFAVPFDEGQIGLFALLPQVAAAVEIPVIAAGSVMSGAQIAAALLLGASGVQLGSALLATPECGTSPAYKAALAQATDTATQVTRSFSGRPARGLRNRFMQEIGEADIPDYPIQNALTAPLRAAANAQGRAEFVSLWAGQGAALACAEPTAAVMSRLIEEFDALV
ncbi:MAG: nitronate monooxygenase family protein [Burkholderiales bacterium]|nr:nitronate monooxygenase family protein [Burkholderiales bacterium]